MDFIRSAELIRAALSDRSGIGLSLMLVRDDSVEGKAEAEARTMDRIADIDSWDGGSEAFGAWNKSGWDLSE
ncbi:hypothetical protein UVI_02053780 [Ustilaginoidea virens]|uniref:Uncharacterized protein n=1 Tax=Ustilaginoidea virens TaxID=1159556 RepID=A0A1B5KY82_USTVR|nr:hypothetical protein UVI_02053780 [Ustilaginoidea virens]